MINKIIRYFNQNRKSIIIFIVFVTFFILLLQLLNQITIQSNKTKYEQNNNINTQKQQNSTNINNIQTGEIINNYTSNNNQNISNIVAEFIKYCNQANIEQAYNMLTNDCKKIIFPNIEDFKNNYHTKIFTTKKAYKLEQTTYSDNIYKITYTDDNLLATGGLNTNSFEDYIYITRQDDSFKISLNNFLYIQNINKKYSERNITIEIIEKQIFMNYEIYNIKITNNLENNILITSKNNSNSIALIDENETKYSCYIEEILDEKLVIQPNRTNSYELKFNKLFNTNRKINAMEFSDIITNYNEYINGQQPNTISIKVQF